MKLAVMDSTRFAARTGVHATFARDHEYKRHGTVVSLLAGIELLTGKVHASETATAVEVFEFLKHLMPPIRPARQSS